MKRRTQRPRVAWIPPFTGMGHERFPPAKELFEAHGFPDLEYCDIDGEPDERQLARLDRYDILYLTGGDPIGFRLSHSACGVADTIEAVLSRRRLACRRQWWLNAAHEKRFTLSAAHRVARRGVCKS